MYSKSRKSEPLNDFGHPMESTVSVQFNSFHSLTVQKLCNVVRARLEQLLTMNRRVRFDVKVNFPNIRGRGFRVCLIGEGLSGLDWPLEDLPSSEPAVGRLLLLATDGR